MKLLCIGDSLTFGFKMNRKHTWPKIVEKELGIQVNNKGICGDTTAGMLSRFGRDVLNEKPTHVMIMGGANDLIFNTPMTAAHSNIATLIYQAYHYRIEPIVGIHIPMVPDMAKEKFMIDADFKRVNKELFLLREWILKFSNMIGFKTIDLFSQFYNYTNGIGKENLYIDGVHPTIEGNKKIATMVIENLKQI